MPATSSACRSRPTGRSAAAARAAPAWRRATRISSPACSSPTPIRRCCSSRRAGQVYKEKVWRLPLAAPQAARQGAGQHAAARAGRAHHHHHAAARGRGVLGQARRDVRHVARHRSAQQALRFRPGEPRRQDRHEARRGRATSSTCRSAPRHDDVLLTTARGQCIRFPVDRRPGLQGPRFHGRARHQPGRRRPRHLDGDPAPHRRHREERAAISRCAARSRASRRRARSRGRDEAEEEARRDAEAALAWSAMPR